MPPDPGTPRRRFARRALLLLAAAAVALLALAGAAPLSEATVTVQRNDFESRFPDGMRFRLDATADRPIQDVVLRYWLNESRVVQRARPQFTPGQAQLRIEHSLETGRTNFLPPLTPIRYEWELLGTDGSLTTVPGNTVTYQDQRFDWKRVQAGNLEVWYYHVTEAEARAGATRAMEQVARLERILGTGLTGPVRGVVYSPRDIQSALSFRSDTTTTEGHFGGEAHTQLRMFTISGAGYRGIAHETAHQLVSDALSGRATASIPSWLNEGLAQWVEGGAPRQSFSRLLRFPQMDRVPSRQADVSLHYAQSHAFVDWLIRTYGEKAMGTFVLNGSRNMDPAAERAYGKTLPELEDEWRVAIGYPTIAQELAAAPPPAPAPPATSRPAPERTPVAGESAGAADDAGSGGDATGTAPRTGMLLTLAAAGLGLITGIVVLAGGAVLIGTLRRRNS